MPSSYLSPRQFSWILVIGGLVTSLMTVAPSATLSPAAAGVPPEGRTRHAEARLAKVLERQAHAPQRSVRAESWTPTSHVITEGGRTRVQLYGSPKFHKVDGRWEKLTGRVESRGSVFPLSAMHSAAPIRFSMDPERLVSLSTAKGLIEIGLPSARSVRPRLVKNGSSAGVEFASISKDVDLRYDVSGTELKETLVLMSPQAAGEFRFVVHDPEHALGDAIATGEGGYKFTHEVGGGLSMSLAAPTAWDRRGDDSAVPGDGSVRQTVDRIPSGYSVRVTLDQDWRKTAEYPIYVDPTVSYNWTDGTLAPAYQSMCTGCPLTTNVDGSMLVDHWPSSTIVEWNRGYIHADLGNVTPWIPASATLSMSAELFPLFSSPGCSSLIFLGTDLELQPGDTSQAGGGGGFGLSRSEVVIDSPGVSQITVDVTDWVKNRIQSSLSDQTNFEILPSGTGCDSDTEDAAGALLSDVELTLEYTQGPLPPPIPTEQTWGCDCRWAHGADSVAVAGDPVNTASGHQMEHVVDLSTPAPGIPVTFARTYNGQDKSDGPLGVGWTHEYNASLSEDSVTGDVLFRDPSGGQLRFQAQPDGEYEGQAGVTGRLATIDGGGWSLTSVSGEVLTFDDRGRERSDRDRTGRGVTLGYAGSGGSARLVSLTDEVGRVTNLTYGTTGAEADKLTEIAADDGRSVRLAYSTIAGATRLTSATAPDGKSTNYTYDANSGSLVGIVHAGGGEDAQNVYDPTTGRIVEQTDAAGHTLHFNWEPSNHPNVPDGTGILTTSDDDGIISRDRYFGNVLSQHIDAGGGATSYSYDGNLNVVGITDPRGNLTTMTYDGRGNMLTRTAPEPIGTTESWTYDSSNLVTSHTNGAGETSEFEYSAVGQLVTVTDPLGHKTNYTYDSATGRVATTTTAEGRTSSYVYDDNANLLSETSPGGAVKTYTYDESGNQTSATTPRGNEAGAVPADFTTTYTYDDAGRVLTQTDPSGSVTTNAYDADGRLLSTAIEDKDSQVIGDATYTYDAVGRPLTRTEFGRTTVENAYDLRGRLVSTTDAGGGITTYAYDEKARSITITTPRGNAPEANSGEFTWVYIEDANGNRTSATDPDGNTTATLYDQLNRVVASYQGSIVSPTNLHIFSYDDASRRTESMDALGHTTTWTYDAAGRVQSMALPGRDPTVYAYDDDGHRISQTSPSGEFVTTWTYTDDGQVATQVDPAGNVPGALPDDHTISYSYGPDGGLTAVTDQLGHTTSSTYDAFDNQTSQTDARGNTTTWDYDAAQRLVAVTPPGGADPTTYGYDDFGNLLTATDARGNTTTFTYDDLDRITVVTDPLGRTTTYDYDLEGNLIRTVTARGNEPGATVADWTIEQTYDSHGRVIARTTGDAATSASFSYDIGGNLSSMIDSRGTTTLSHDGAGHLTDVDQPGDDDYSYTYTDDGQVATRTYPRGGAISYSFDDDGMPITQVSDGLTTTYHYTPNGQLAKITYPASIGLTEKRAYDATGRVASVALGESGTSTVRTSHVYTRDAVGNPTGLEITRGDSVVDQSFVYDERNWLIKECPTSASCGVGIADHVAYSYDEVGNRVGEERVGSVRSPGATTYVYDEADELTEVTNSLGTVSYSYDAEGHLITGGRSWDLLGRMTASNVTGSDVATYSYDGFGNRRSVSAGTGTTSLSWDVNSPVALLATVTRPDGSIRKQRYTPDGEVLTTVHPTESYAASWYAHDGLGSVSDVFTENGTGAWGVDYDAFGIADATALIPGALETGFGYTGEYLEPATGDYYLRARDYQPAYGRFTGPDPVRQSWDEPRLSRFIYADNRPTVFEDPSGQDAWDWVSGLAAAGAVIGTGICIVLEPCGLGEALVVGGVSTVAATDLGAVATAGLGGAGIGVGIGASIPVGSAVIDAAIACAEAIGGSEPSGAVPSASPGTPPDPYGRAGNNVASRLNEAEIATLGRLRQLRQFVGRTFRESPHVGAEYVDDLGRSFDALGSPAASTHWNARQFLRSIDNHVLKTNDFTVIDLTGFTPEQIGTVTRYVSSLSREAQARIVRIGF
jgi:RHS repeat-associated protein